VKKSLDFLLIMLYIITMTITALPSLGTYNYYNLRNYKQKVKAFLYISISSVYAYFLTHPWSKLISMYRRYRL